MRQAQLTKPAGALGRLEELSINLAGMTGTVSWRPQHIQVVVCAGDHGVVAQGVSAYPQVVSTEMVRNMLAGGAAISVLCRQFGYSLSVVDAGLASDVTFSSTDLVTFYNRRVANGTSDFTRSSAMSSAQSIMCVETGVDLINVLDPLDLLILGEMGIGNTTAASAIIAAITGANVHTVTGYGTGITSEQKRRKVEVIQAALEKHHPAHINTLEKVGGLEIGMMAGLMIGAAHKRIPILLDGLIATAAALIAEQMQPGVRHYLIAGHQSAEPGHTIALHHLGLTPLLNLDMRLGEGTGAVLAVPLIQAAMATLQHMATFDEAQVSDK